MKKNKRQLIHAFNMVEIVLAMGVLAIAIGSVMGLLPVALKANRDAVAENCMASATDLVRSFVEFKYRSEGASSPATFQALFPSKPGDPDDQTVVPTGDGLFGRDLPFNLYTWGKTGLYYFTLRSGGLSGDQNAVTDSMSVVDFDAIVKIWVANPSSDEYIYIPKAPDEITTGTAISGESDGLYKVQAVSDEICNVMIEISYPVDASEENRETRSYSINLAK